MSSDIKFLLGFIPLGVTLFLLLIGIEKFTALLTGVALVILYAIVVAWKKFYKTPPVHIKKPYYQMCFLNVIGFLFAGVFTLSSGPFWFESISFELVFILLVGILLKLERPFFVKGKPDLFGIKWSICFIVVVLLLFLFLISFELFSDSFFLFSALFTWFFCLTKYLMVKLAVKMG